MVQWAWYTEHGMVHGTVFMVQEKKVDRVGIKTKMLSAVLSPVEAALEGSSGPS